MSERLQLEVVVNSETGQLEILGTKLQETGKKAEQAEGGFFNLEKGASNLAKTLIPLVSATAITKFFIDAVRGAEEEAESIRRLSFALEANGISWEKNASKVNQWASAIQQTTRFSDTEAYQALEGLSRVTGDLAQAQKAAQVAMGLSVSTGQDLSETTRLLKDLINGNERALIQVRREFGSLIGDAKTTQDVLDILSRKFADVAEKEENLTKETHKLKNAWGEFSDTVGTVLTPAVESLSTAATKTLNVITAVIQKIQEANKLTGDTRTHRLMDEFKDPASQPDGFLKKVTESTQKEADEQVRIVARKNDQQLESEKRVIEERNRLNQQAAADFIAATQGETAAKLFQIQQEVAALEAKGIQSIAIKFNETTQIVTMDEYKAAREKQINEESIKQIELKRKEFLRKLQESTDKEIAEEIRQFESTEKSQKDRFKAIAEAANFASARIAQDLSKSLTDTLLRGKEFEFDMKGIFFSIIQEIIRIQIQMALVKGLTAGAGGGALGAFLAPGLQGAPAGAPAGSEFSPAQASSGTINVYVNLSTETLNLDDRKAVLRALAEEIAAETADAVRFTIRSKNLADRNSLLSA